MKRWILNHRVIVTAMIIIGAILAMLAVTFLGYKYEKPNLRFIELVHLSSQIISILFIISGTVIATWQYYLSCVDSKRNLDVICVQKAIDLSEYYKDNILFYLAPIIYIFEHSGINTIISKIDKTKIKHFDTKELQGFITDDDIMQLKKIQCSDEFFTVVIKANTIYDLGLNPELVRCYEHKEDPNLLLTSDPEVLSTFLGKLITRTLNNMEFFALHFTHNVADESVVYKSLHQTYIDLVQILYYKIASVNPLSPQKYFTNVIELYDLWNNRSIEADKNFADGVRTLSNKGTVIEN